jgi:hypothetical protein
VHGNLEVPQGPVACASRLSLRFSVSEERVVLFNVYVVTLGLKTQVRRSEFFGSIGSSDTPGMPLTVV